ncbi:hypothetical protein SAMN05421820_107175 [Pedobacter steynii]|uniref:Uncharacterized protein n=1 Tax=Pedobacter steynii TaxID=430522 RepID=A0A1H0AR20_9SPHI|nr:hypothetical protein SAMN05421820_107175 [Pedobacter steynii]
MNQPGWWQGLIIELSVKVEIFYFLIKFNEKIDM